MKKDSDTIKNQSIDAGVLHESEPDNFSYIQKELKDLRENQNLTRQLIDSLPAAVYTCDRDGHITMFNEAAANLWGRRPAIGKDLWCGSWKIYNPDGTPLPLNSCPMALTLKEGRPVHGREIIIERPDGIRKNILPHPVPLFDSSGRLTGAFNMLVDLTPVKKADAAIRESEERFRSLADKAPVAIWMSDEKGDWTYVNRKWSAITGKNPMQSYGKHWYEVVHPDDRESVYHQWTAALSDQLGLEIQHRVLNTEFNYIFIKASGSARYNSAGDFIGHIGILEDVTDHVMAKSNLKKQIDQKTSDLQARNEELRRSEERYHRMVAEVQDYAIILLNRDGVIQNWNKGAEKIKGYTAEEAIGKSFRIFYTPEDQQSRLPEKLLEIAITEGRANHEGWRVRKDGSNFWGNITITALHDSEDNIIGFSKVTRDLTERKAAEEKLKSNAAQLLEQNRALEAMNLELSSFAYVSSHDLQEPLRKIQTFASRIIETEHESLSAKGKDYFSRMQNAALRMQTLIDDLLAYSRTNTTRKNFERTDLNTLVEEVKGELKELIDEKRAIIKSVPLPQLNVIKFQFRQLLTNLFSNSLKFSKPDEASVINITYETVKGSKIQNSFANPNKTYHHISVEDNGIGFETEHRFKIFEVFQRLHGRSEYSGTGIGLAICKKIVENHSGIITADAKVNEGATFHLYLPE